MVDRFKARQERMKTAFRNSGLCRAWPDEDLAKLVDVALAAAPESSDLPSGMRVIDCNHRTMAKAHSMRGPFCHVGSLINKTIDPVTMANNVERWRRSFLDLESDADRKIFVGLDYFEGPNVDRQGDLCSTAFATEHADLLGRFGTVICRATLEHVSNPFVAASNVAKLIAPGGCLFYSGPWIWGYHGYPANYFNISFDGLEVLFPDFDWKQRWYESTKKNVGLELDDYKKREKSVFRLYMMEGASALISDIGLPYLNLGAVGVKRDP